MHKSLLEYIDVVAEETSPTSIILAVAELMRKEADASRETAKTSIFVFLDKLKNAGLAIDYTGLKSYFDADPRLSNVIQQFNDREIEFVGQGDEDEAPDTGAPVGEVPPEKKVNQMAKAALAKRESVEEVDQNTAEGKVWDNITAMVKNVTGSKDPNKKSPGMQAFKKIVDKSKESNKKKANEAAPEQNFLRVKHKANTVAGQDEDYRNPVAKNAAKQAQLLRTKASNITTGGPDNLDAIKVVSPAAQALADKQKQAAKNLEKKNNIMPQTAAKPDTKGIEFNMKENVYGGSPLPMNNIDKVQSIMDNGSAMKIDGVMVDTFTASLIMDIYNKVNEKNQDKMRSMPVEKLASAAYKLANRQEKKEEVAEEYYYDMVGFIKMSDDKLKAWIKRNDTDEPGISPVFGQQIKSAKRELIKRGLKLSESINNVLRLSGIKK